MRGYYMSTHCIKIHFIVVNVIFVVGKCRSSKECPKGRFCRQGECTTDPCNPSPCGIGGECTLFRGQSKCSCQQGYTGLPPNCVKSCTHNEECSETEACIKSICQSPCPGKTATCGQFKPYNFWPG